jgi:hypothetical protein
VLQQRVGGAVGGELPEHHDLDVRLALQQVGKPGEHAERVGPVQPDQHEPRTTRPHPPNEACEPQVGGLRVGRHGLADRDRVRPDRTAEPGLCRDEEQRRELSDDAPVGLLRERAQQVVGGHPTLEVHHRDLPPERDLRGHRRGHPAPVDHHGRRVEVDEHLVEACHERGRDGSRLRGRLVPQQHRDVCGYAERLEGLVHRHRIGPSCDRDSSDPVGLGESSGDRRQPRHVGQAARDEQDVVVVLRVGERVERRVELGHAGSFGRGSWPYGVPGV